MTWFIRAVSRLWFRLMWRLSPRRTLHRIAVAVSSDAEERAACFDRVEEALDLIARYDPATLDDMRGRFDGILVFGTERFRVAYWHQAAGLCVLTASYVLSTSLHPESVAMTLVHENMHARLDRAGVVYREDRRAAIEVLCAMAELAFARRIAWDESLVTRTERRIDEWSTSGNNPWSDRTMEDEKLQYLRELGTPGWIVRVAAQLARLVRGRAA